MTEKENYAGVKVDFSGKHSTFEQEEINLISDGHRFAQMYNYR